MSSQLRVDSIVPVNGVPTGGGGGIIQIVQESTQTEVTVSTTTWTDTTLTATITPTSSSNKILVVVNQHCQTASTNTSVGASGIKIFRNSTEIYTPLFDSFDRPVEPYFNSGSTSTGIDNYFRMSLEVLDSPATTSAVTYKTQVRPHDPSFGSGLVRVQRNLNGSSNATSFITLMEVSG